MAYPLNRALLLVLVLSLAWAAIGHAEKLTINLSSGSVVVVDAPDQVIDWKTINRRGEIEQVTVNLSQVEKIDLSNRPASVQILKVKRLLAELGSDDYQTRVNAQNELSQPSVGRRFKDLVEAEQDNASLEVRRRVKRVIDSFENSSELEKPEYDHLYLKDGKVLVGDVGEFVLKCKFQNQNLELKREVLRRVTTAPAPKGADQEGPLSVRLLHRHEEKFFADPARFIDFETDDRGDELISGAEVSTTFVSRGIIFEAEEKDFIGVSGFPLKFRDFPTGGNSVCPIDQGGGYTKKFRGVIRISFCKPGLPDAPAGVHQFGLFASRIDNPRDLILEAYNADSQMIGCVESTDQAMVFLGIESSEPIAFVRVLSNPYLFDVSRKVDETYVIDHVWFGEPVSFDDAKLARVGDQLSTVVLRSGDILSVEDARFTQSGVQVYEPEMKRRMTFAKEKVHSIRFGGHQKIRTVSNTTSQLRTPDPASDEWAVMLTDGSVLSVIPGETFKAKVFDDAGLRPDQVVGLWAMRDPVRFPMSDDFVEGKHVLVFPTCRVISKVNLTDTEVSWDKADTKIEQPVFSGAPTEDVTPTFDTFLFARRLESQMPTVWFKQPKIAQANWGAIDLVDGQKIVLGSEMGFAIDSINDQMISIVGQDGMKVNLPMTQVHAIKFPK